LSLVSSESGDFFVLNFFESYNKGYLFNKRLKNKFRSSDEQLEAASEIPFFKAQREKMMAFFAVGD